jgi:Flp pilus assembly pilin Flp
MLNFINTFRANEDGAVTVDWVVLTAALVLLGFLVLQTVGGGVGDLADDVVADLGSVENVTP